MVLLLLELLALCVTVVMLLMHGDSVGMTMCFEAQQHGFVGFLLTLTACLRWHACFTVCFHGLLGPLSA